MASMDEPAEPWVYKPTDWDHEELHRAYQHKPEVPPNSVIVTMLDENGRKTPSTALQVTKGKEALELKETDAAPIRFVDIRYVSTNCKALCRDHVEDDRFIIMVSLSLWEEIESMDIPREFDVHNLFIQPESADDALDILNFLRYHMFQFLKVETEEEDPTSVLEYNGPRFSQECKVQVHWRKYRKTWHETRILVLDSDCAIFYRKPLGVIKTMIRTESGRPIEKTIYITEEDHDKMRKEGGDPSSILNKYLKHEEQSKIESWEKLPEPGMKDAQIPRDRMYFWLEQGRKTVSKVSRIKSQNLILLHSLFMYITIEYDEETGPVIEEAFQQVKPVPKRALEEPKILFHWLAGNYDPETGKILPPVPVIEPVELDEEEMQKLEQFERELYEGILHLPSDQSDVIWNNMRPHLEEIYINKQLPKVDETEWGCDPNSVDSLLEVILMIETELFRNVDYVKALATTVAMTEAFKNTGVEHLRNLLKSSPVDILHQIHMRGNVFGQPSLAVGRESLLLPVEDDDIPVENEELEEEGEGEEEMEGVQEVQ